MKGVPVRLVMGGRDLENNTMEVMRRDTLEKETCSCDGIEEYVKDLLEEIQANIYKKALDYRNSRILRWTATTNLRKRLKKAALFWLTGTEQPKPKRR